MLIPLLIIGAALLSAFLRRRFGRETRLHPAEMARHRLASERERREWIFPFEI